MMLCIKDLQTLELFRTLPESRLNWICDRAEELHLAPGEVLVHEGDAGKGYFILAAGRLGITRSTEGNEMPLGQHEAPISFGEVPILTEEPVLVTIRAISACRLHRLTCEDFLEVLHSCRQFERLVFKTVQQRVEGLTTFIRQREKMAALGTLSAGLAHELNNPAAAVVRALQDVVPALIELQRMTLIAGQAQQDEAHTKEWIQARDQGYDTLLNHAIDFATVREHYVEQSYREDELLTWLEDYGIEDAWRLAEPLASGGMSIEQLEHLIEPWRNNQTEMRDLGFRWLALSFEVLSMITSGLHGAKRMSELVQAMKSYSHLDQGVQQIVDVHEGIEDTLRLFAFKLKKGIEIRRNYDCNAPKILAYGSELNQVWTNLIDNAIDAMGDRGVLEIITTCCQDRIEVQIIDSGSGIAEDARSRLFEPFFTTKPVGKGTGLGLELCRRIVENRHQGALTYDSVPGRTRFLVCLPVKV